MRKLLPLLVVVATLFTSYQAAAQDAGDMAQKPWSVGALIGFSAFEGDTAFTMEIPLEYAIALGPGNLVPHVAFMLHASDYTAIAIPMGLRYKMHITQYPLYVYPLFDVGPMFWTEGEADPMGWIRFGAGVSYMVHPNVELLFQPIGLGAVFGDAGGFVYNFELGAQAHF